MMSSGNILDEINYKWQYFCTEDDRIGTYYHEFQIGRMADFAVWREDSILMNDDDFRALGLKDLFKTVLPYYDYYGNTLIDEVYWEKICEEAKNVGGQLWKVIEEADIWVKKVFETEDIFTIVGI